MAADGSRHGGFESETLTLRADKPFQLGGWKLSTRADLPIVRSDVVTPENLDSDNEIGLSDLLLQALLISPPQGKFVFAFGTQLIRPTGSDDQFTTRKWQLAPTAAAVCQLPEVSRGTFVALLVRDALSFAGKVNRPGINFFSVQPIFNLQLPDRWFATFGPEATFDTKSNWDLFLPCDVTAGRKVNTRTVVSLQADVGIVDELDQYDWQLELRIGFFF